MEARRSSKLDYVEMLLQYYKLAEVPADSGGRIYRMSVHFLFEYARVRENEIIGAGSDGSGSADFRSFVSRESQQRFGK